MWALVPTRLVCILCAGCKVNSLNSMIDLTKQLLIENVWYRAMSRSHPAWQEPEHKTALEAADADGTGSGASLQYLARLKAGLNGSKAATLQYSDLYGVPCVLVLCEKGRMGDTFPQTFCCLDLRIRTSDNHTTFVQELGRLCRYPACSTGGDRQLIPICAEADGQISVEERLDCLKNVL